MNKNEETFETWNNVALIYQEKFMDLDIYNATYDSVCNALKPNAKLLEVGCGPGNITKYLLNKRTDFDIFGIDIAVNMITLAEKNNPTARFAVMDSRKIQLLTTKYDGVINGFCLPYLSPEESKSFISNAYDLLNENGLLYLSFVEGNPALSGFKVGSRGRVFFYFHRLNDVEDEILKVGFDDINVFKINYPISATEFDIHTILVAKKKSKK